MRMQIDATEAQKAAAEAEAKAAEASVVSAKGAERNAAYLLGPQSWRQFRRSLR